MAAEGRRYVQTRSVGKWKSKLCVYESHTGWAGRMSLGTFGQADYCPKLRRDLSLIVAIVNSVAAETSCWCPLILASRSFLGDTFRH